MSSEAKGVPSRIYVLDGLRLCAALLVLLHHLVGPWDPGSDLLGRALERLSAHGFVGVELFFLISGFVICMSSWGRSLGHFFTSRVARLFPAYLVAVLGTAALLWLVPGVSAAPDGTTITANITMLQQFLGFANVDPVYWTLIVELKFYLLFALVVAFGVTYRRVVAFCLIWATLSVLALQPQLRGLAVLVESDYAVYFVAGVVLFLIHRFGADFLLGAMLLMTYLIAMVKVHERAVLQMRDYNVSLTGGMLQAMVTVFFIVMLLVALGFFSKIRWRWLTVAGALTYPLYLLHRYFGRAMLRELEGRVPHWLSFWLVVIGLLLLAWLVHRLVERPGARLIRRKLTASFARMRWLEAPLILPAPRSGLDPAVHGALLAGETAAATELGLAPEEPDHEGDPRLGGPLGRESVF